MMWTAFESREFRWLAIQEFISIATVMTLSTISSVEEFLSLHASIPIATLALWIVLADSSGENSPLKVALGGKPVGTVTVSKFSGWIK